MLIMTEICLFRIGVRVGEHNIITQIDCEIQADKSKKCNGPVQDLPVQKIITHPGYDSSRLINDIGLVKIAKMNLSIGR